MWFLSSLFFVGDALAFDRLPLWAAFMQSLVLVRGSEGDTVGDVVLVAAGERQAVYARLSGRLSNKLPQALGDAVSSGGTDGVKRELMSLTDRTK
jgi:hypothetical protein